MTEERNIEKVVERGLIQPTFDLIVDYSEMTLDTFLDNEIVKNIPVVKTIVGMAKGVLTVREIFLVKKLMIFLQDYHSGKLTEKRKEEFLQKFSTDEKYRNSVIQQIVIMNDRFVHIEKSRVLSNLFQAHVNDRLTWEGFCDLSEYIDTLHTRAFKVLADSGTSAHPFHLSTYDDDSGGVLIAAGMAIMEGNQYSINIWGQAIYYFGIKGDIDHVFAVWEKDN